jgi:PRTRC genetic system protein B
VQTDYLQCRGLLPGKLLYLNNRRGYAIWHTSGQQANLLFSGSLHVPCGQASVPAMVWKADRDTLTVFALKTNHIPKADTVLYQSPFLNVYADGQVCMGTVDTNPASADSLEDFMKHWEQAFWNSYFSHLNVDISPVKGNVIQLWKELVGSDRPFPNEVLKKTIWTLNDLII